ncbi:hypothetical protein E3U26_17210 (plasmid) [Paracoccus ferrooxidans]|nr:hypothetical protein E3U26_17210 [Paracoccus ferrooxidans]
MTTTGAAIRAAAMTTMRGTALGGWFGHPEGHAEATRRGWDHRRDDDDRRYSSHPDEDDDRRHAARGRR